MWINVDPKKLEEIIAVLNATGRESLVNALKPVEPTDDDDVYQSAAIRMFASDDCEIDVDAAVSKGGDPGAWVHCWRWVSNEDAGIEAEEDE